MWEKWAEIHNEPDQAKRAKRAYEADNTPLSIDRDNMCGRFQGNNGRYDTTLERCTCIDFARRKLPCKHMYRLAIELGLFGDKANAKNDQYARKVPKSERSEMTISVISKLENYRDEEQLEILSILLDVLYHQKPTRQYKDASILKNALADGLLIGAPNYPYFIREMRKVDLMKAIEAQGDTLPKDCKLVRDIKSWMISRVSVYGPLLFPDCMEVRLGYELNCVSLSVYKYLHRKFDEDAHLESLFDPEIGEFVTVEKGFPDDFETGLLNMFGTNPLSK